MSSKVFMGTVPFGAGGDNTITQIWKLRLRDLHTLRPLRLKSTVCGLFFFFTPNPDFNKAGQSSDSKRKLALTEYLPCVWHIFPMKSSPSPVYELAYFIEEEASSALNNLTS